MRILLINDFSKFGGAEVQHWREFALLNSRGHDVYSLTLDSGIPEKTSGHKRNLLIGNTAVSKLRSWVIPFIDQRAISEQIEDIQPDVIHIANIALTPFAELAAIRRYPVLQTIRDYSAVCPKATCLQRDGALCDGYQRDSCMQKCPELKVIIKLYFQKKLNRLRVQAINRFVSPSSALAACCTANGIPTECLNNPYKFEEAAKDTPIISNSKRFLYYGLVAEHKGILKLIRAFKLFHNIAPDATLDIVGKLSGSDSFVQVVQGETNGCSYLNLRGPVPNSEVVQLIRSYYCVVVPSLWLENYPNTVLEPLANSVLVIGSNRGGIPELITDKRLLFNPDDESEFVDALKRVYELSEVERQSIVSEGWNRVRRQNSIDLFGDKLERLLQELASEHT